jgi:hypothetical protein
LNSVATSDVSSANNDVQYKKISRAALAKSFALWNKASCSASCAEIVREKLNACLLVPNATRWNSFFDSVDKLRHLQDKTPEDVFDDRGFSSSWCCAVHG